MAEPVVSKIKGLGKDYITLAVTILLQNLIDLGHLLSISGLMGLMCPSIPDNVAQVIKGWSPATLLTVKIVNGMVPSDSLGGLTNTMWLYELVRQGLRSLRACTAGVRSG